MSCGARLRGNTLFPQFDSYRFEAAGYVPYDKLMHELRVLSTGLYTETSSRISCAGAR